MQKENLDHEFSTEFRQEIKNYGWRKVVVNLLESNSEKNPKRIEYTRRECAKKPTLRREILGILGEFKRDASVPNSMKVLDLERAIMM